MLDGPVATVSLEHERQIIILKKGPKCVRRNDLRAARASESEIWMIFSLVFPCASARTKGQS